MITISGAVAIHGVTVCTPHFALLLNYLYVWGRDVRLVTWLLWRAGLLAFCKSFALGTL
jgi:hypothetical protein